MFAALRDSHLEGKVTGRAATDREVYEAILRHTPDRTAYEVRELYERLYGGDLLTE